MAITKLVISGADSKTISLAHKAQSTSVVPDDNITATNVQDALEQLDDIKAPIDSPDFTGTATMDGLTVNSGTQNLVATFQSTDTEAQIALVDTTGTSSIRARNDLRFHVNNLETPALKIDSSGDISFYEDTGTTPKLLWDASAEQLIAKEGALLKVTETDSSTVAAQLVSDSDEGLLQLYHGGSEKVRLRTNADSYLNGGNLGIGTDSAQSKLHVQASSASATGVADGTLIVEQGSAPSIQILSANTQTQSIKFGDPQDGDVGRINYSHATDHMGLFTNGTEALRIDSSQNVGIGISSPDSELHINSSGETEVIIDSGGSSYASKLTFTADNQRSQIIGGYQGGGGGYLAFNTDSTSGSDTERMRIDSDGVVHVYNGIDFGGSVNSGGTVSSSNKLDDYEEGTWTPAPSGYDGTMTVNSAAYTKIGRLVHLRASVTFSDTADGSIIQITGLPFAQGTANTGRGGSVTRDTSGSVAFTDGSASTVLRMLSNTHSTVTYTAVRGATVEFFHIYDA